MKKVAKGTMKQLKQTMKVADKNQELIDTLHIGEPAGATECTATVLPNAQLQCY